MIPVHIKIWLRIEGAALFATAVTLYVQTGGSWLLFACLILAPDLFMLGYLRNSRFGAAVYNFGHTYAVPLVLAGIAVALSLPVLLSVSLIWIAHIGADRAIGYGLKYGTDFKTSHLSRS